MTAGRECGPCQPLGGGRGGEMLTEPVCGRRGERGQRRLRGDGVRKRFLAVGGVAFHHAVIV